MLKTIIKALCVGTIYALILLVAFSTPVTGRDAAYTPPVTSQPTIPSEQEEIKIPEPTPEQTIPEESLTEPATEPPHVHEYQSSVTPATCTEKGYTIYICTCGMDYTGEYTEAMGHNWGEWKVKQKSTWFEHGRETRCCTQCDASESRQTPKRTIPNSGTITIMEPKQLTDYLVEPKPEDFGKYYDNAVKLYNAFKNQQEEEWIHLFFSEETYELEQAEWRKFKAIFEKTCFQECGVSIYVDTFCCGAFPEGAGLTRVDIKLSSTYELYTACHDAIKKMGLYTGMSQYDAVLTMNEWMRKNITYELQHWKPLDVLQTGKAQCAGYAYLFEYLCKYTGIDATYVTGCAGHSDGECGWACHAWNKVQLAGKWYYLDICWNDSKTPNRYFLTEKLWSGRTIMSDSYTA